MATPKPVLRCNRVGGVEGPNHDLGYGQRHVGSTLGGTLGKSPRFAHHTVLNLLRRSTRNVVTVPVRDSVRDLGRGCHGFSARDQIRSRLQAASPRRRSGLGRPITAGLEIMVFLSGRFSGLSAGFSHGQDHLFGNQPAYHLKHVGDCHHVSHRRRLQSPPPRRAKRGDCPVRTSPSAPYARVDR